MNAIAVFDFEEHPVRQVAGDDGGPWFVGIDVCRALGHGNSRQALARLEEDERADVHIVDVSSSGVFQSRKVTIISEPGCYRLVFTSRTEAAERFKRWLAHEVLPAIRRTGRYDVSGERARAPGVDEIAEQHGLAIVREARRTFGRQVACAVWRRSPALARYLEAGELADEFDGPGDALEQEIAAFVAARCREGGRVRAGPLWKAYAAWCAEAGREPANIYRFGRGMARHWRKSRSNGVVYEGISLDDA